MPTFFPFSPFSPFSCFYLASSGRKEARGTLSDIAAVVEREGVKAPAVVIIGNVVDVLQKK